MIVCVTVIFESFLRKKEFSQIAKKNLKNGKHVVFSIRQTVMHTHTNTQTYTLGFYPSLRRVFLWFWLTFCLNAPEKAFRLFFGIFHHLFLFFLFVFKSVILLNDLVSFVERKMYRHQSYPMGKKTQTKINKKKQTEKKWE